MKKLFMKPIWIEFLALIFDQKKTWRVLSVISFVVPVLVDNLLLTRLIGKAIVIAQKDTSLSSIHLLQVHYRSSSGIIQTKFLFRFVKPK